MTASVSGLPARALAARGRCSDRLALDESLCAAIRGGARVVLLADAPMELQPIFPHWQAARVVRRSGTMWQGDWISSFSWLRRDGPFARIPAGR